MSPSAHDIAIPRTNTGSMAKDVWCFAWLRLWSVIGAWELEVNRTFHACELCP